MSESEAYLSASSPRILVIEDDADIQEMLQDLLRTANYTPIGTPSGEAALLFLEHEAVDLIVLDLRLPGMHGFEVCERIRNTQHSSVPIFMLTGHDQHSVVQGLQLGADDYLTKPFSTQELLLRLQVLLRRHHERLKLAHENQTLTEMLELIQNRHLEATSRTVDLTLSRELVHNMVTHLQSLYAIVESEYRRAQPGPARDLAQRVQGRLQGAVLVYQISEFLQEDPVAADQMIHTIAHALKRVYSPRKRLPINIDGDELSLPLSYASPLAMVVNEAITNCFKHAFPNQRFGSIDVRYQLRHGILELSICDDGIGIPTPAPLGRGRAMISEVARNLQGKAVWRALDPGTELLIQCAVT